VDSLLSLLVNKLLTNVNTQLTNLSNTSLTGTSLQELLDRQTDVIGVRVPLKAKMMYKAFVRPHPLKMALFKTIVTAAIMALAQADERELAATVHQHSVNINLNVQSVQVAAARCRPPNLDSVRGELEVAVKALEYALETRSWRNVESALKHLKTALELLGRLA